MSFRVRMTEDARADLEQRLMSLAEYSPEAADRLNDRFIKALVRLRDFPFSCGLAYESASFPEELRHLLFGIRRQRPYRALFTIRGDEVVILAIRAPGERPIESGDLLLDN